MMRMKLTVSLSLLILWCSVARASLPSWELLPECLRKTGYELNRGLHSFDKCKEAREELQETGLQGYFDALAETKNTLEVIRQLLEDPTRDVLVGYTGATGQMGSVGNTGFTGPTGRIGPSGLDGLTGAKGKDGVTGPKGPTGPRGDVIH